MYVASVMKSLWHFQQGVVDWAIQCFGLEPVQDKRQRLFRFGEEALELLQAGGITVEEVDRLKEYVYSRPIGDIQQEVGGVMTTLATVCYAHSVSLEHSSELEIQRCWDKIQSIRAKHLRKPNFDTPLPGADS